MKKNKPKPSETLGQHCADRLWDLKATLPALTREHVARVIDEEYQRTLAPLPTIAAAPPATPRGKP